MTSGFLFWLLMLLWAIFGGIGYFGPTERRWAVGGFNLLLFLLLAILGWKLFGQPLKG